MLPTKLDPTATRATVVVLARSILGVTPLQRAERAAARRGADWCVVGHTVDQDMVRYVLERSI